MKFLIITLVMLPTFLFAQPINYKNGSGGTFSLGVRTTASGFNSQHEESPGMGVGGQFRIQFADQVNSDWFFDYLRSDLGDYASRTDYHIGWSVLYYLRKKEEQLIKPYLLAGHCFDYTRIVANKNASNFDERWSSAVQGGLGVHFNLSPRLDLSLVTQYMLHLGNEIEAVNNAGVLQFKEHKGGSAEGHLLFNVSINYKIADLW